MEEPPPAATIVECEPTRRRQSMRLLLSDGRELSYSAEACRRLSIAVGTPLDASALEELDRIEQKVVIHEAALRLLGHRARSTSEMRTRLAMRGFADAAIEHEIERLDGAGLLDDAAFARAWVADRQIRAPRGRSLLRYELQGKGVPPQAVEEAVAGVDDDEVALDLARRQARKLAAHGHDAYLRKAVDHLHRKGISRDLAFKAAQAAWDEALHEAEASPELL